MPGIVRRALLCLAVAAGGISLAATGVGAQELPGQATMIVRKVIEGSPPAGSTITLVCTVGGMLQPAFTLDFDATGAPTTSFPGGGPFERIDGAWRISGRGTPGATCEFSETATGGASSTAWTCTYTSTEATLPSAQVDTGCSAPGGTGTGPFEVVLGSSAVFSEQTSEVVFTNTYTPATPVQPTGAPAVVLQPTFTG